MESGTIIFGKRIGFALGMAQLRNPAIHGEIKQLLLAGAEINLVLLDPSRDSHPGGNFADKNPVPVHILERVMNRHSASGNKSLDLWVIVANSESLLFYLTTQINEGGADIPLVLLPAFKENPAGALHYLSKLMQSEQVFFVPFGVLLDGAREERERDEREREGREREGRERETNTPSFFCRTDLLVETCAAALQGQRVKPAVWEDYCLPR